MQRRWREYSSSTQNEGRGRAFAPFGGQPRQSPKVKVLFNFIIFTLCGCTLFPVGYIIYVIKKGE